MPNRHFVANMERPFQDVAPPYAHIRRGLQSTPTPALSFKGAMLGA